MHPSAADHGSWRVDERTASAAALHARWPAVDRDPEQAAVALCRPEEPAVVLGSTQAVADIDRERASATGVAVARRRSGGGAVLVTRDDPVWVDVWVPAGHVLWHADVSRAFDWVGETWAAALGRVGVDGITVHRGAPLSRTRWASKVCFGGIGAGEVVTSDGRKVVGLAQRRTRAGAWFHTACILRWSPGALIGLLDLAPGDRESAMGDLTSAAVGAADLTDRPDRADRSDRVDRSDRPDGSTLSAAFLASLR